MTLLGRTLAAPHACASQDAQRAQCLSLTLKFDREGLTVWGMCRGQKHQRREKQAQHLDNSEELSHSAVAAVLSDGEPTFAATQLAEHISSVSVLTQEAAGESCTLRTWIMFGPKTWVPTLPMLHAGYM